MTKVLLIMEGERCEKKFFDRISALTSGEKTHFQFFVFKTSIYQLYSDLKEYHFEADIEDVLRTSNRHNKEEKRILNEKFAYKYLIFDFDYQDPTYENKEAVFNAMISYFSDETENGKLLINYPMMESFRDMPTIGDPIFFKRTIEINELEVDKNIVDQRGNTIDVGTYLWDNFLTILRMNLQKFNDLLFHKLVLEDYCHYQNHFTQENLLKKQFSMIRYDNIISVINCGILLLLEYFWEKIFRKLLIRLGLRVVFC